MAECEVCGRHYDELNFQLVVRETARGFDRVECALHAQRAMARAGSVGVGPTVAGRDVLEQLERTAAELFMARAELASERRRRRDLEERAALLAGGSEAVADAVAASQLH
jgi:hypothetical protein